MNNNAKLSLFLLSGMFSIQASEETYFQKMKAMVVGIYDQYLQAQQQKREQEKQRQAETEFLKQISEEAEQYRKEEELQQQEAAKEAKRIKQEEYKEYFQRQEVIHRVFMDLGIPGVRPLNIDANLAESILTICPEKVQDMIIDIEQRIFFKNKKNIIFYGPSGTGKSALAQAIAIQCKVPCFFFNAGTLSTEYMNSGVQNLNRIFVQAEGLAIALDMPCIIILDELESLTRKHAEARNHENNILISFWQELDKLSNSQVIVIGTMNSVDDVPDQVVNRTCMIEIPLPTQQQREAIISYYLQKIGDTYNLEYPEWFTAAYFARQTKGFSNRDLENVVTEALKPAIRSLAITDRDVNVVKTNHISSAIKQIKQDLSEQWTRVFKRQLYDSKILMPVVQILLTVIGLGIQFMAMRQSFDMAEQQMNKSQIIAEQQMNQSQMIAEQQMSIKQIAKTTGINTVVASQLTFLYSILKAYL